MRILADIPHKLYKITLFEWNDRYIVKIESGPYEQIYKLDSFEFDDSEVPQLLDTTFMEGVTRRFGEMHAEWTGAQERNGFNAY